MKKEHVKVIRIVSWGVFIIYLIALVYFLFFCEQMGRVPSDEWKYNLLPLREIKRYVVYWHEIGIRNVMINLLGNVVCFVPFGFVLPIISRSQRKGYKIFLLSVLSSLLVELIQLVSKVGTCDIDDILLNTLGGMIGYLMFYISHRLTRYLSGETKGRKWRGRNGSEKEEKR